MNELNQDVKILIVEDEFLIAKGLARKLKQLGYKVVGIVASGDEALEKVAEKNPDLVLMDIVIEGEKDGIETAEILMKKYELPVIYLTAYADEDTLHRAEKSGSYGYILKPFKEREVHGAIKIALKKHQEALTIQKSLQDAHSHSQQKERYFSIASHDLRNPLTAIQMSVEMLQDYDTQLGTQKKQEYLQLIQDSTQNMNELLEDLLVLSRAESGKLKFEPKLLNVIEITEQIFDEFKTMGKDKHNFKFIYQDNDQLSYVDEKLLRHILSNLLSNALKYSPQGGTITLEIFQQSKEIIWYVKDEGIGIPAQDITKLFSQFERASNVGDIKGTGLGLSIVKEAVELHNGKIRLDSKEGKGTTFTVIIPCEENAPQEKLP